MTPKVSVGSPFNPYKIFNGIFVPEALVRSKVISSSAKLAYGRLTRYAGQDGQCYPSMPKLAAEIGLSTRQVQRSVAELEKQHFIRRVGRFLGASQTSNVFEFLWHEVFVRGDESVTTPGDIYDTPPVTFMSPKDSQTKENQSEETNRDIDCPITNRKTRDSQSASVRPSVCRKYPKLREILGTYMKSSPTDEKIYPKDRHVVDIMDAARGSTEDEVIKCLCFLYDERGLRPGTRNGPRNFAWFPVVVQDYFDRRTERQEVANPIGFHQWEDRNAARLDNAAFAGMTDAIEIDNVAWQ